MEEGKQIEKFEDFRRKWLVLIDIDVAVHLWMSVKTIHSLRCPVIGSFNCMKL